MKKTKKVHFSPLKVKIVDPFTHVEIVGDWRENSNYGYIGQVRSQRLFCFASQFLVYKLFQRWKYYQWL